MDEIKLTCPYCKYVTIRKRINKEKIGIKCCSCKELFRIDGKEGFCSVCGKPTDPMEEFDSITGKNITSKIPKNYYWLCNKCSEKTLREAVGELYTK